MTLFRQFVLPLALLCAQAQAAAAAPFENLDLLEGRIVATLGAGIGDGGGPVQPVDRRLKLAACTQSPEIAVPTPASAVVRCRGAGWQIYIPLVLRQPAQSATREAVLVRKGDQVELIVSGAGFTVTSAAVAQQDGAEGELVRVRADLKSAPVAGRVVGRGQVAVGALK